MQANNRDFDFQKYWLGPEEKQVTEGFDALYDVPSNYSIPAPSAPIKQKLASMGETVSAKKDTMNMESAMSSIFGKFIKKEDQHEIDFAAKPVEEPLRSPLQVVGSTASVNIVLVEPRSYEESTEIVQHLKQRKSVILNLQQLDQDTSMRVLDFVSGATYAMDGTQERVGNGVFIFASINCRLESESHGTRAYKELFSKTFGV